jgi:integrase
MNRILTKEEMTSLIEAYLNDKIGAWSVNTLRSEGHRLRAVADTLRTLLPKPLWTSIQTQGAYTRLTTWSRVVDFVEWGLAHESPSVRALFGARNLFADFRKKNRMYFNRDTAYSRKLVSMSYEEALRRIQLLDEPFRQKALRILLGGLRYMEEERVTEDQNVIGKGGRSRKVFLAGIAKTPCPYTYRTFLRKLQEIGLKPHDLRKLAATRFAQAGMSDADLLKVMGWKSMETAKLYLQPKEDEKLEVLVNQARNTEENACTTTKPAGPILSVSRPSRKLKRAMS